MVRNLSSLTSKCRTIGLTGEAVYLILLYFLTYNRSGHEVKKNGPRSNGQGTTAKIGRPDHCQTKQKKSQNLPKPSQTLPKPPEPSQTSQNLLKRPIFSVQILADFLAVLADFRVVLGDFWVVRPAEGAKNVRKTPKTRK